MYYCTNYSRTIHGFMSRRNRLSMKHNDMHMAINNWKHCGLFNIYFHYVLCREYLVLSGRNAKKWVKQSFLPWSPTHKSIDGSLILLPCTSAKMITEFQNIHLHNCSSYYWAQIMNNTYENIEENTSYYILIYMRRLMDWILYNVHNIR